MKTQHSLLKIFIGFSLILLGMTMFTTINAQVKIGVFADCQYCDFETQGNRYYKNSLLKLKECVNEFNSEKLDFTVGLGDLIDRDFASFEKVNSILNTSKTKVYNIIGNHDFSVDRELMVKVPSALNLKENYYTLVKKNWLFIFLNGNEVSLQSLNEETVSEAKQMLAEISANKQPNNKEWNGGLGASQINWLEAQLKTAESEMKNVAIFCHYPLFPLEAHTLWDSQKVLPILKHYNCVKAWINGHNHAGNYAMENQIHFVTMHGMVDTETENAFSVISFEKKWIRINGKGREISRDLSIRQ